MASQSHTETALITLRQKLLSGVFEGGERLFEVSIAEDLNISRTPVRAALSKLAEEGLLDRAKGGGFEVRRFDVADVLDTIALRGVLEGTAARFAAERGVSEDQIARGAEILDRIDQVFLTELIDMTSYSKGNQDFHALLSEMSGSAVLARELGRVTSLPFASPSAFLDDETKIEQLRLNLMSAHEQHKNIMEAIQDREGARAESLAREHARAGHRNANLLLSSGTAPRQSVVSLAMLTA